MMKFETTYPPVKLSPSVDDCIRAGRTSDYLQLGGITAASWGFGFIRGRPARFGMAGLMAGIGFTFGTMVLIQNTRGRLMGFRENSREISKYGQASIETNVPEVTSEIN
jgi:NADH-ubiquinone oxidoreductase complex I, 21 kDa subunit